MKNNCIECAKYTYEVLQKLIVKPINDDMKFLNRDDMSLYFMWDKNNNTYIKYVNNDNQNEINYVKTNRIKIKIIVFGCLAFFATMFGNNNTSSH